MKRRLTMIAAVAMAVCVLMAQLVVAASALTVDEAEATTTVAIDTVEAVAGTEVVVPVKVTATEGFMTAMLEVKYDDTALTLVKAESANLIPSTTATFAPDITNPYLLAWANDLATENITATGDVAYLTFEVSADAEIGATYAVSFGDEIQVLDADADEVAVYTANGGVTVVPEEVPTDAPATDEPVTDAPATDAPATDAPATDAPAAEETTVPAAGSTSDTPAAGVVTPGNGTVQTGDSFTAVMLLVVMIAALGAAYSVFYLKRSK